MKPVKIWELEGKVVGIYLSANWFAPCRKFNELLLDVYEQLKRQGCDFEIVLVSSDEDIDAFNSYRATMPWLSVPFSDLETKRALNKSFNVEAMPCLVFLQPNYDGVDGDDATMQDGVELIYRYGTEAFPFTKERLETLHKEQKDKEERQTFLNLLTNVDRDYLLSINSSSYQVPVTSLQGKTIGLYFSAQWCLPCVKFIPKLISIYQRIKQNLPKEEDFEIVFVSSDTDEASFLSYFERMPWLALPFGDRTTKDLAKHFDVREIPCLVILGPDGKTVTKQGRYLINLYQENAYPFTDARLEFLEKQMDQVAKSLPKSAFHLKHQHELNLVSERTGGGPFICCDCDEQGYGWAYQCLNCGFEVHPKSVRPIQHPNT
ncbi:probable nucleoredoxin 2 [Spinacia oleracea]|uniref:protein-disulfide reductase n=1 Tax=Spinacia oleracea TaxID=3562 RepID=A0ABM3R0C8_SPIOL|nr:probable nucleoredoxin 2 [Spinacia oleracea]